MNLKQILAKKIVQKASEGKEINFIHSEKQGVVKVFIANALHCKIKACDFLELKYWIAEYE